MKEFNLHFRNLILLRLLRILEHYSFKSFVSKKFLIIMQKFFITLNSIEMELDNKNKNQNSKTVSAFFLLLIFNLFINFFFFLEERHKLAICDAEMT